MLYPKIDDCIREIGDKYSLVVVAARRGKDVGVQKPAELAKMRMSELTYAMKEIAEGRVTIYRGSL